MRPSPPPWARSRALRRWSGSRTASCLPSATRTVRPLVLGRLGDDTVVASESCALDLVGADTDREVRPGELVLIGDDGVETIQAVEPAARGSLCIFEFFYLARPTRAWPASRFTARACGWASDSPPRRPRTPISCCRSPTRDARGNRLRARNRHSVQRGPDQEPLRRPDIHPAGTGHARTGDPHEVQSAGRGRGQAAGRGRRLDRARLDDAADRRDALRRRRGRGARSRLFSACRVAVLLRHRPRLRGRDDRVALDRRGSAGRDRRDEPRLPLARRSPGCDTQTRERVVPRLPHARLSDARSVRYEEAPLRGDDFMSSVARP